MTSTISPAAIASRVRPLVALPPRAPRRAALSAALGTVQIGESRRVYICYYDQAPELLNTPLDPKARPRLLGADTDVSALRAAISQLHAEHDLIQVAIAEYHLIPELAEYAADHAANVDVMSCPTSFLTPYYEALLSARTTAMEREREKKAAQEEQERVSAEKKHWFVGTDASLQKGRAGAGIACVREDGSHSYEYLPHVTNVLVAEILAIELAVREFTGRLTIYSDSQRAVSLVRAALAGEVIVHKIGHVNHALNSIKHHATARGVAIHWVRGHNGFALNETADRLARFARRSHNGMQLSDVSSQRAVATDSTLPPQAVQTIVGNIISDLHAVA